MSAQPTEKIMETLVQQLATMLSKDPSTLSADTPLPLLGVDSLRFVELLIFIEKVFDLKLMELGGAQEDFRTVRTLAARISQLQ